MFCSRDARQVLNQISEKSGRDNFSASDFITAEEIIYQYLPAVACSVIKSKYPKKSKKDPTDPEYFIPILKSYGKGIRNTPIDLTLNQKYIYSIVAGEFVIEDFSFDQLKILFEMGNLYNESEVRQGIKECLEVKQYSILYLNRVVSAIHAKREKEKENRERLRSIYKAQREDDKINRSPVELAMLQYQWQQKLENQILDSKMEEWLKNEQEVNKHQ